MIKHILLICILSAGIISCKNADKNLRNGWAAFDDGRHEEAARQFDMAIQADGHDWNKGYAQKCQLLRAQYFSGEITKDLFLTSVRSVYDEWFEKNPNDEAHLVQYAVLLFLTGEEGKSISLMESVYDSQHCYNFENPSISDVQNFFAGRVTGKVRKEDFSGTVYEFLFDAAEEDLISIFVGH